MVKPPEVCVKEDAEGFVRRVGEEDTDEMNLYNTQRDGGQKEMEELRT